MDPKSPAMVSLSLEATLRGLIPHFEATNRAEWLSLLRADMQKRWRRGEAVSVEAYLRAYAKLADDAEAVLDLIYNEVVIREELGQPASLDECLKRFPQFAESLRRQFALHQLWSQNR